MRKDFTVFAALVAASLVATPMVMSAGKALATADEPAAISQTVAVMPVEVAPVAAPAMKPEACTRKVRVVYSGYGSPETPCAVR